MGRPRRQFLGSQLYHVMNRANGRSTMFRKAEDYRAFEGILRQASERFAMRLCCYCVMPNHWHLAVWLKNHQARDFSRFMQWLTLTHTQRYHAHYHSGGMGHLYQGRFKSFPVQIETKGLNVFRYIEQNALRAKLVEAAQDWPYGSAWQRGHLPVDESPWLAEWPWPIPRHWKRDVNVIPDEAELAALRSAVERGSPLGDSQWVQGAAARMGLNSTLRPQGRPRKNTNDEGSPGAAAKKGT